MDVRATYRWVRTRPGVRDVRFAARHATAPLRALPDFVILGAQKSGTTSMYRWLTAHPLVAPAIRDEVHYFDWEHDRSLSWYRAHFPMRSTLRPRRGRGQVLTGESSPAYLFYPWVPPRVAEALPSARFLVFLRNPVDRAYSQYSMNRALGRERRSFEEAVDAEAAGTAALTWLAPEEAARYGRYAYAARGHYAEQLERWFAVVPRERVLITFTDRLAGNGRTPYDRVLDFLELPAFEPTFSRHNEGRYDPMDEGTRRRLEDSFAPHNARLATLLGEDPPW